MFGEFLTWVNDHESGPRTGFGHPQSGVIAATAAHAAHIAVSAVHGVDFLLTWNCAHIANAQIVKKVQSICLQQGFPCPLICTPEELMGS